ncbi:hypothetical protein M9R32_06040 [Paenisporosarcina quisquiliarum]|uniref:Uncharacterized protein n=1 Tax=Paenisporosarcina quisquiliarum TaxID=365346 RepID=A0A9X3LEV8_9BACL|nr:hypothetical protein [Paenisporosarcina quisquiliarum]MCZ8536735.1 hypothetical protein [Paenisporosarcina quisquiliarum]
MARGNNRSLLLAGLAAGAYAYFSKPENREKALVAFNNTKTKVNSYLDSQKLNNTDMTKVGHSEPHDIDDNKMLDEGASTSVQYYNEEVQENKKKTDSTLANEDKLDSKNL